MAEKINKIVENPEKFQFSWIAILVGAIGGFLLNRYWGFSDVKLQRVFFVDIIIFIPLTLLFLFSVKKVKNKDYDRKSFWPVYVVCFYYIFSSFSFGLIASYPLFDI